MKLHLLVAVALWLLTSDHIDSPGAHLSLR